MTIRQIETAHDHLAIEADCAAPPTTVFDFLILPELVARWWAPQAQVDPRAGGEYVMSWPAQGWQLRGEYTDFDPGQRLAFSWHWDHEPDLPMRHVTIVLEAEEGGTHLRLIHGPYGAGRTEQADRESHRQGWLHFLARLAEAIARGR